MKGLRKQKSELRQIYICQFLLLEIHLLTQQIFSCSRHCILKRDPTFCFAQRRIEYHTVFKGTTGETDPWDMFLYNALDVCYHIVWSTSKHGRKCVLFTAHVVSKDHGCGVHSLATHCGSAPSHCKGWRLDTSQLCSGDAMKFHTVLST